MRLLVAASLLAAALLPFRASAAEAPHFTVEVEGAPLVGLHAVVGLEREDDGKATLTLQANAGTHLANTLAAWSGSSGARSLTLRLVDGSGAEIRRIDATARPMRISTGASSLDLSNVPTLCPNCDTNVAALQALDAEHSEKGTVEAALLLTQISVTSPAPTGSSPSSPGFVVSIGGLDDAGWTSIRGGAPALVLRDDEEAKEIRPRHALTPIVLEGPITVRPEVDAWLGDRRTPRRTVTVTPTRDDGSSAPGHTFDGCVVDRLEWTSAMVERLTLRCDGVR
ncbi:MAG TPA: hypothetical protein VMV18_11940 [bacterium]|nr:hypothetical protein [bacterium]